LRGWECLGTIKKKFSWSSIAEYDQFAAVNMQVRRVATATSSRPSRSRKAARAERLKNLLAKDKKDDGVHFDELGVDHIFLDEAHYFKNLETPTRDGARRWHSIGRL